jgi:hypothetical protein
VVLLVGGVLLAARADKWSANASVVVLPTQDLDPGSAAGYYETLSRGQMVETIAEIIRLPQLTRASEDGLRLSPADRSNVGVSVGVVPNTAMITTTVTAGKAVVAENLANQILGGATFYIGQLNSPYVIDGVSSAAGTAKRSGVGTATLFGALLIGALMLGLAAQQLVYQVVVARQRRRGGEPATADAPPLSERSPAPEVPSPPEVAGNGDRVLQAPNVPGLQRVGPWGQS